MLGIQRSRSGWFLAPGGDPVEWNAAQPAIVDIALGERSIPEGQSLFQAVTSAEPPSRHPDPVAEWFEPAGAKPLLEGEASPTFPNGVERRQGILRVHAAEDSRTRRDVEEVIDAHAKRWVFESDDRGAEGPTASRPSPTRSI